MWQAQIQEEECSTVFRFSFKLHIYKYIYIYCYIGKNGMYGDNEETIAINKIYKMFVSISFVLNDQITQPLVR
jgi:hypothetical protein